MEKKFWVLGGAWVSEFWRKNGGKEGNRGQRWCGGGRWRRRGAAVVIGRCLGGGFLDVREFGRRESMEEVGDGCIARRKWGRK
jgi:hypothetical protein